MDKLTTQSVKVNQLLPRQHCNRTHHSALCAVIAKQPTGQNGQSNNMTKKFFSLTSSRTHLKHGFLSPFQYFALASVWLKLWISAISPLVRLPRRAASRVDVQIDTTRSYCPERRSRSRAIYLSAIQYSTKHGMTGEWRVQEHIHSSI